jgi:hypothetical protein
MKASSVTMCRTGYVLHSCRTDEVSTSERLAVDRMMYPSVKLHLNP